MRHSFTILLAAEPSLIQGVFHDILRTHGYKVLVEGVWGLSSAFIAHTYRGPIHLLIGDMDFGGPGKGLQLAVNIAFLRPLMQVVYFRSDGGRLWMLRNPGGIAEERIHFTPGVFLVQVNDVLSESFASA